MSAAFGKVLGALFLGIRPVEPDILVAVLLLTSLAIAGATYLPARRAARVDPIRTLNADCRLAGILSWFWVFPGAADVPRA